MPFQLRIVWAIAGICLWPFFLLSAAQVYEVAGVVRGKLLDGRPVIEHEEIPDYMPAMTMAFNISDTASVTNLEEGDIVQFQFHVDGKHSYADNFQVTGKEAPKLAQVLSGGVKALEEGDSLLSFQLIDENGRPLTEESLKGQITLMTFIFSRCPVPEFCPLLATKFLQVQSIIQKNDDLADQVRLLSVTLDPEFDTAEILQGYAKRVGADSAIWGFVTGDPDEIRKLARSFDVISSGSGATLNHTLTTALIDSTGKIAKLWPGNRWKAEEVVAAIRDLGSLPCDVCCSEKE